VRKKKEKSAYSQSDLKPILKGWFKRLTTSEYSRVCGAVSGFVANKSMHATTAGQK
jgi:hypothetical protein